ncbi:hypothetical protein [Halococcus sediminicola]|uniref:hypothetical protein n=1 Tax=Halococcus sediminicola TaxID=1264579 RepID=UPI0006787BD5|nr:hypothetical protein [Halococcus sediminicola]
MSDSDEADREELTETAAKLDSALDSAEGDGDQPADKTTPSDGDSRSFVEDIRHGLRDGLGESLGASEESGLGGQFGRMLGEMVIRTIAAEFGRHTGSENDGGIDPGDVFGEESLTAAAEDVLPETTDALSEGGDVVEETKELLETVDLSELPDAIDMSELPEAIDMSEVPAAVANADPKRAVEPKQLASLIEFGDLFDATDIRAFMQNKDELEDEVDDLTDDEGEDDSGLVDSLGSDSSAGSDLVDSVGSSADSESGGGESFIEQGEAMQAAIQSKLQDAIGEFRESALDARDGLKDARDEAEKQVEEKTGGGTGQPSSRNPTAFSTMTSGWNSGGWSSANFSTVPKTTRHSNAPGHFRIYGRRFDEREEDDDE